MSGLFTYKYNGHFFKLKQSPGNNYSLLDYRVNKEMRVFSSALVL